MSSLSLPWGNQKFLRASGDSWRHPDPPGKYGGQAEHSATEAPAPPLHVSIRPLKSGIYNS